MLFGIIPITAYAQNPENWRDEHAPSCDPEFADVLEARANLEAMREVEIAQTLILKPDSVLEYSCFHIRNQELDEAADDLFSDNVDSTDLFNDPPLQFSGGSTPYAYNLPTITTGTVTAPNNNGGAGLIAGPHPPGGELHTSRQGNLIGLVVSYTLFEFVYDNFGHEFAGGTFVGPVSPICNPMEYVWNFLRCVDFNPNMFLTLPQMAAFDPRTNPIPCDDEDRADIWSNAMIAAYPEPGQPGGVSIIPLGGAGANVYTHSLNMMNINCGGSQPIPTGVRVYSGVPPEDTHADAVCSAPGCYYNPAAGNCVP